MTNRMAFYGSLRSGHYNAEWAVKKSGAVFEGYSKLYGYEMYSFGSFPGIVPVSDKESYVILELYNIPDDDAVHAIHWMEVGSGYIPTEIKVSGKIYTIYVYGDSSITSWCQKVQSGDWSEFKGFDPQYTGQFKSKFSTAELVGK